MEQPTAAQAQRNTAADVTFELAEVMAQDHNSDEAVRYYKEALLHNDGLHKVCMYVCMCVCVCLWGRGGGGGQRWSMYR